MQGDSAHPKEPPRNCDEMPRSQCTLASHLIPQALGLRSFPPHVGCSRGCHRSVPRLGNPES